MPDGTCGSDINARVDVNELMGNEIFLHLAVGSQCSSRGSRRAPRSVTGEDVCLTIDTTRLHVFDKDSTKAISGPLSRGAMPAAARVCCLTSFRGREGRFAWPSRPP